jgi:thymidylate synthase
MTKDSLYIQKTDLSHAWAQAFLAAAAPGGREILPLVVTVTGFTDNQPTETSSIRQALDQALLNNNRFLCETVASTIFPQSLWNPSVGKEQLFQRYKDLLPELKKLEVSSRYGLYFERLIAFGPKKVNQLDHIIRTYQHGNHRRSALQASVFDPSVDHTNQRQRGFPCMQQVAFAPTGNGEMAVTAFYAVQYLFEKAYGNYLGLCHLGHFIAQELGLRLTRMTCIAGTAELGHVNKGDIQGLLQELKRVNKTI